MVLDYFDTYKRKKYLGPQTLYIEISSGWTEDLNVKGETSKLVKNYTEGYHHDLAIAKDLLNKTEITSSINIKVDKLDFIKI